MTTPAVDVSYTPTGTYALPGADTNAQEALDQLDQDVYALQHPTSTPGTPATAPAVVAGNWNVPLAAAGRLNVAAATGDTTLTSDGFTSLPAVAMGLSQPMKLVLWRADAFDTLEQVEVVYVSAHVAGADTVTVVRAQESTTAEAWDIGDRWSAALTPQDLADIYSYINSRAPGPPVYYWDDFQRVVTDDVLGAAVGTSWTCVGNFNVQPGIASPTPRNSGVAWKAYLNIGSATMDAVAKMRFGDQNATFYASWDDVANTSYWMGYNISTGQIDCGKTVAGTTTVLAASVGHVDDHQEHWLRIVVSATTVDFYLDGGHVHTEAVDAAVNGLNVGFDGFESTSAHFTALHYCGATGI